MLDGYEKFKKDVYALTSIDLNCYKEKQMKRRIDTLITKNKILNGCKLENTYNIDDKVIFTYEESYLAIYKNEKNTLQLCIQYI